MKKFFKNLTDNTPKFLLGLIIPFIVLLCISIIFATSWVVFRLILIIFLTVWVNIETERLVKETEKLIQKISKLWL